MSKEITAHFLPTFMPEEPFLKKFLNSHSGFDREEVQNYLNLFAFIMNE